MQQNKQSEAKSLNWNLESRYLFPLWEIVQLGIRVIPEFHVVMVFSTVDQPSTSQKPHASTVFAARRASSVFSSASSASSRTGWSLHVFSCVIPVFGFLLKSPGTQIGNKVKDLSTICKNIYKATSSCASAIPWWKTTKQTPSEFTFLNLNFLHRHERLFHLSKHLQLFLQGKHQTRLIGVFWRPRGGAWKIWTAVASWHAVSKKQKDCDLEWRKKCLKFVIVEFTEQWQQQNQKYADACWRFFSSASLQTHSSPTIACLTATWAMAKPRKGPWLREWQGRWHVFHI